MLPYTKVITNRDLLYTTGTLQCSIMAYIGKESKKVGDVRMCITDSLGYTEETNTTLVNRLYCNNIFF